MAVFIKEDSAKKLSKEVELPQKLTNLMVNKNNYYGKLAPNLVGAKRAKKIANAAEKEQYNTKSNKFKEHGSGVTLNYNEIKRWDDALRHLPKNSDAFDANGGETAREMVNDLKKQIRRDSQQVPMIEPVEKLVQDVKVSDKKNKPSKLGSADVYMESKKTIYLKESHLSILKEYYNQLTLPFDGNYHMVNGQRIPTKKTYEYYIDWLEEIGRYGTLNGKPNDIPKTYIDEYLSNSWDELKDNFESTYFESYGEYVIPNWIDDLLSIHEDALQYHGKPMFIDLEQDKEEEWDEETSEYVTLPPKDNLEFLKEILEGFKKYPDIDDLRAILTPLGKNWIDNKIKNMIHDRLEGENFWEEGYSGDGFMCSVYRHPNCENGLLYIERVIRIPNYLSSKEWVEKDNDTDLTDYYQYLNEHFYGIGDCWTYEVGGGEDYCGNHYGKNDSKITLKGKVRLTDIDWEETIYLNVYCMNYEKEIRLKQNALVELDEIEIEDKKFPLKQPLIVPAMDRENLDECKLIKEEVSNQDTPQDFVRVLKQLYQNGTLTNSSMSNEDISNEIKYQLENNPQIGMFKDNINEFGFIDKVLSQNGKIYIERAITINSVEDMLNYEGDGVGTSWSWEKGGAEAYFGNGNIQIILKGYVNLEDINWESTVFLNAYPLNGQKEIRVEVDSPIELFGFAFNGKKYKIKNPLLVNSGFTDIGIM